MFQVVDIENKKSFEGMYTTDLILKVLQTDNKRLDTNNNFRIPNTKTYDKFTVISCDGYVNANGDIEAYYNIKEEDKPGRELSSKYRYDRGNYREYKYLFNNNPYFGNNERNQF